MSFTYCKSCGHKNIYAVTPPKFCGGCGASLGSVSQTMPIKKVRRTRVAPEGVDSEDGEDINEIPNIGDFKFSVSNDGLYKEKIKLGQIVPNIDTIAKEQLGDEETQ